jgi:hypothetical protein
VAIATVRGTYLLNSAVAEVGLNDTERNSGVTQPWEVENDFARNVGFPRQNYSSWIEKQANISEH